MNAPKASPRFQSIRLRSLNKRTLRRKSTLVAQPNQMIEGSLLRTSLINDVNSPKYLHSSRHTIESYLPVISDKDSLNTSMNSFANATTKLNGSFNRSQILSYQITPQSHSGAPELSEGFKCREEEAKSSRLSRRNSISREKSNSRSNLNVDASISRTAVALKASGCF